MIKFGTDGWRALIDKEFNLKNVGAVTQAISDYLKEVKKDITVVVGYDVRRKTNEFARTICSCFAANNIKVVLADKPASTPMVSFTIKMRKLAGGIMLTASHNPPQFHGIKFKVDYAGSATPDITKRVESLVFKNEVKLMDFDQAKQKNLVKIEDLSKDWLEFIRKYIDLDLLKDAKFKVLFETMHGCGNGFMKEALSGTNIELTTIHENFDSNFGGVNPEPIEKNLEEFLKIMKEGKHDIGIAVDGDVDRIGAARPDGKFINAHQIISLIALHLIEDKKWSGAIAKTVAGTRLINKIADKHKRKLFETPVGFKHICTLMLETDVLIGGEESGGIGFKNYIPERDGILSGLLLLEMMAHRKKTILEIMEQIEKEYGKFCYRRIDSEYPQEKKPKLVPTLKENSPKELIGEKVAEVNASDGIKFISERGSWLLLRLSGTEPIIRMYAEADSDEKVDKLLQEGKKLAFSV